MTMHNCDGAMRFLIELSRGDLAELIRHSRYIFGEEEIWSDISVPAVRIVSPRLYTEALTGLPEWDQKRIVEAMLASDAQAPKDIPPSGTIFESLPDDEAPEVDSLYPEMILHRNQMMAVATGKLRIQDANDYYRARHQRISAGLNALGMENPIPYADLWDWYHKWKEDFPSYSERRRYLAKLFEEPLAALIKTPRTCIPVREPTGWERVDRALEKAHNMLGRATHAEDYQAIGLLCREILISLGQAVFDPAQHSSPDGVTPGNTDAERMISAFLVEAASGGSNENVRKHAKASLKLAVELQHKRSAEFRIAALCLEATSSITNLVAILAGRRDSKEVGTQE